MIPFRSLFPKSVRWALVLLVGALLAVRVRTVTAALHVVGRAKPWGLFSLVTLMADRLSRTGALEVQRDAWCEKPRSSFSDALAVIRILLLKRQREHYSGRDYRLVC
ncbi:hypothetical protein [Salinibacter sp. 10B]|uniref:hypothetical protein n=1 Tax=Salinibacter sp. 10B TaxID=1923971 RepID=UPI0011B05641|nr:hypothetical protein [Salinibacter sp. 10B]